MIVVSKVLSINIFYLQYIEAPAENWFWPQCKLPQNDDNEEEDDEERNVEFDQESHNNTGDSDSCKVPVEEGFEKDHENDYEDEEFNVSGKFKTICNIINSLPVIQM